MKKNRDLVYGLTPFACHCGEWGRYLLNPETSHALKRCLFRLVTRNKFTEVVLLYEAFFLVCSVKSSTLAKRWPLVFISSLEKFNNGPKLFSTARPLA